ncbi:MAG: extracellular solute-binding protein [Salinivirgaceae bacterium]|jgi:hypothetical protein|nr:extracellular solute-binding protein [Salinivirgaceae bacterium]
MNKNFNKYIIVFGLLFFVVIFQIFTNCKQSTETKVRLATVSKTEAQKQVRFIGQWLNEGKREKLVRDFVREYEFENQDVDIILEFPEDVFLNGDNPKDNETFVAEILEKEKPEWDIIRINNQYNEITAICGDSLWPQKHLVDFSAYPQFRRNTMPSLLSEEVKDFWKGIIPGPFLEGQYYALWSNNKAAQKVGIEIKQVGMTIEDFVSYIKAVYEYNKNNPQDNIVPLYEAADWQTFFTLAYHLYASEVNNIELLYKTEISEEKLLAWYKVLQVFEELSKYNFAEGWEKLEWIQCGKEMLKGNALFYINGSWMYNIWDKENSELTLDCYPNEFPVFNETNIFPGGYLVMWGVLKNSPNKEEAIKFLLAMNKPEMGDNWVQYTKCPTGIKTTLSEAAIGSDQFEKFTHHVQKKYGKDLYQVGPHLIKYIVGIDMGTPIYITEVLKGELSAKEAYINMRINLDLNQ